MHWTSHQEPDGYAGSSVTPPDPYWIWARLTEWAAFIDAGKPADQVGFIAEVKEASNVTALLREAEEKKLDLAVPPLYSDDLTRHFTGRVARDRLHELSALPGLARWELGAPVAMPAGPTRSLPPVEPTGAAGPDPLTGPVMAVIDDACAFLHQAFADNSGTPRMLRLWDQGFGTTARPGAAAPHGDWQAVPGLHYGRELVTTRPELAGLGTLPNEATAYLARDYLVDRRPDAGPPPRLLAATHGTHVMHMAGGWPDPVRPGLAERDQAAKADLVFIGLPPATAVDTTAGSLAGQVVDGLRYLLSRVAPGAKVVASISYGCEAGPHDGSNLLETAVDELMERRGQDFVVLLGAGNSRMEGTHASRRLKADETWALRWQAIEQDQTDTFLEIWYPRGADLRVQLTAPTAPAMPTPWLSAGEMAKLIDDEGHVIAAAMHLDQVPNGRDPMVLLAMRPTDPSAAVAPAPAGLWAVKVKNEGKADVDVNAWVETDEPGHTAGDDHSRLLDDVTEDGTLSGYATGRHSVVAGGMRLRDGEAAPYSSLGPVRSGPRATRSPSALAPAEQDEMSPGFRAAATLSSDTWRMNGTSVATPWLGRLLLNHLADAKAPVRFDQWQQVINELMRSDAGQGFLRAPD
ncbi:MAG: S8 family serine peptidase [Burkholderiaceae bacterium]